MNVKTWYNFINPSSIFVYAVNDNAIYFQTIMPNMLDSKLRLKFCTRWSFGTRPVSSPWHRL
jgi:hypothetical protein